MIEALAASATKAAETVAKAGEVTKDVGKEMFDPRKALDSAGVDCKGIKNGSAETFDPKKPLNAETYTQNKDDISHRELKKNVDTSVSFPEITREESIKMAQRSDGKWDDEPGNSKFTPNDIDAKNDLKKYNIDGVEYYDGNPNFKPCSESTVEISDMTSDRSCNFRQADIKCSEKWNEELREGRNDWSSREVKNWRNENHYSWHECRDMKTMNLVPRSIHDQCKHYGGVAECKRREVDKSFGGGFDA